jgi:S1-C subfamily serine protease
MQAMLINRNDQRESLSALASAVSMASQIRARRLNLWGSPSTPIDRSGHRIICLIAALMLVPALATESLAQPPSDLTETSAHPTLASLVRNVVPSVVVITVEGHTAVQAPIFFDPESGFPDPPYRSTDREINAAGVVVDARGGLIVTSTHVTEHADDISVTLSDGRHLRGIRVDADPNTDIAVIRIAAAGLVALPMIDSDTLEVGEYLIAVGNPFGMGISVTQGIVSALHRSIPDVGGFQDFIQTDALLNPGNSGGPLVNLRGELVGIATAIARPAGTNTGIGFAIPANRVREGVARAVKYGEARRIRERD